MSQRKVQKVAYSIFQNGIEQRRFPTKREAELACAAWNATLDRDTWSNFCYSVVKIDAETGFRV